MLIKKKVLLTIVDLWLSQTEFYFEFYFFLISRDNKSLTDIRAPLALTINRDVTRVLLDGLNDSIITTKVKAAFFDEASLKTLQIEVETYKGTVQLSGFVDSAASVKKPKTLLVGRGSQIG